MHLFMIHRCPDMRGQNLTSNQKVRVRLYRARSSYTQRWRQAKWRKCAVCVKQSQLEKICPTGCYLVKDEALIGSALT